MIKMIKTTELRVALGFLYADRMEDFLIQRGYALSKASQGTRIVAPEIPVEGIPVLIAEREECIRRDNPWRLLYEPDYNNLDDAGPTAKPCAQQPEFDLMWFEAYRLGVPITANWPSRIQEVLARYPHGLKRADLIQELGFAQSPVRWKEGRLEPAEKVKRGQKVVKWRRPWKQETWRVSNIATKWDPEKQCASWLAETSDASFILKLYPE